MADEIDYGGEAVDLANAIQSVCAGRPTVSVYLALSMVLGGSAAMAPKPDFDGMMRLVEKTARFEFDRFRAGGGNG
jgi:hypothetical protein